MTLTTEEKDSRISLYSDSLVFDTDGEVGMPNVLKAINATGPGRLNIGGITIVMGYTDKELDPAAIRAALVEAHTKLESIAVDLPGAFILDEDDEHFERAREVTSRTYGLFTAKDEYIPNVFTALEKMLHIQNAIDLAETFAPEQTTVTFHPGNMYKGGRERNAAIMHNLFVVGEYARERNVQLCIENGEVTAKGLIVMVNELNKKLKKDVYLITYNTAMPYFYGNGENPVAGLKSIIEAGLVGGLQITDTMPLEGHTAESWQALEVPLYGRGGHLDLNGVVEAYCPQWSVDYGKKLTIRTALCQKGSLEESYEHVMRSINSLHSPMDDALRRPVFP